MTMIDEEKMNIEERYKYLRKMKKRYKEAQREEKSGRLDEMEAVTGKHRKSLARDMGGELKRHKAIPKYKIGKHNLLEVMLSATPLRDYKSG